MSNMVTKPLSRIAIGGAGFLLSAAVYAGTLDDALVQAWQNNPNLAAERETLEAAGSRVDEAQGGYYPQVKAFGAVGTTHLDVSFMQLAGFPFPTSTIPASLNTREIGLELDQPLYAGGKISAGADAAQHLRDAEDARLHAVEQSVLMGTTEAYMDVLQSQAVLNLEQSNEKLLQEALDQAQASFDNGEVTHTDVDQARARLSGAQAARIEAQGALAAAQSNYLKVVGTAPDALVQPAPLTGLPATEEATLTLADHNYSVVAAQFANAADQDNVDVAASALKPTVGLTAQVLKSDEPQFLFETLNSRSIMLNVSWPLYTGGTASSEMHTAQHKAASSAQQAEDARREARDEAIRAWEAYQTAIAGLAAIQVEIKAAQSAYDGVQAEYREGERTTLDVLNAEQELLAAQVNQVRAQRDETVAEYALKAATGVLTAKDLNLPVGKPAASE